MIACPECGAEHLPGTLFCDQCGAAIHPAAKAHVARTARPQPPAAPAETPPPARRRPETLPPPPGEAQPELRVAVPHRHRDLTIRAPGRQRGSGRVRGGSRPDPL